MGNVELRQETREIDGAKYTVTVFASGRSIQLLKRVLLFVGRPVARSYDEIGDVMDGLLRALQETDAEELVKALVANVTIDGQKMEGERIFDIWFAGKIGTLWKVVRFVVEVNWQSFFDEMRAEMKARMEAWAMEQAEAVRKAKEQAGG